jgi:hypothetical protein
LISGLKANSSNVVIILLGFFSSSILVTISKILTHFGS